MIRADTKVMQNSNFDQSNHSELVIYCSMTYPKPRLHLASFIRE